MKYLSCIVVWLIFVYNRAKVFLWGKLISSYIHLYLVCVVYNIYVKYKLMYVDQSIIISNIQVSVTLSQYIVPNTNYLLDV